MVSLNLPQLQEQVNVPPKTNSVRLKSSLKLCSQLISKILESLVLSCIEIPFTVSSCEYHTLVTYPGIP